MKNEVFKRLAKDTAVYGISSILARTLNFFLLPIYTRILSEGNYGIYTEIFAYIAIIQVVLIFGMETGFFRFASLEGYDSEKVFSTISCFMLAVSTAFFCLGLIFTEEIAVGRGYYPVAVVYSAGILSIDAFTSVFFARLRYRQKAVKFAIYRSVKILSEIFFNLLFLYLLPAYFTSHPQSALLNFFTPEASYVYILAAVFCSCIVSVLLFLPEIIRTQYRICLPYLKVIIIYSLPLMLAGLQGALNDFVDRFLFRYLAPENGYTWEEQLGIFGAAAKLAVIMSLFVQMFRYAAEPYFFSKASKSDINPDYAKMMKYFTVFCVVIFLAINFYSDMLQYILGKNFRTGMTVLPVMLFAYMLSGINQNVSMWYKLVSKTKIAMIVTLAGLFTTVIVNLLFMPKYSYMAAAWGHVASYSVMIFISWQLSKRYCKIPYQWTSILLYMMSGIALFFVSKIIETPSIPLNLIFNTVLLALFVLFVVKKETGKGYSQ
ncbi:MAG: polysaccharide biosynthesis C-terminal domain-containing protein [Prevotellaceae bacterium]|jgi:O-antigen/teichoic acid export membrane protein|nr:polysaccharide biosynthesis C-terminal domain-containing protein [Prevotellaceae bacterium]